MPNDPAGVAIPPRSRQIARRRFNLSDILILVAAAAIGGAWTRSYVLGVLQLPIAGLPGLFVALYWIPSATPLLMSLSLAQLAMRMIRPRPGIRRVFRQPGASACLSAALVLAVDGSIALATLPIRPLIGLGSPFIGAPFSRWFNLVNLLPTVGLVVAGAWLNLALTRRWAAERSWIDRLGRGLGVAWIGVLVAQMLLTSLTFP